MVKAINTPQNQQTRTSNFAGQALESAGFGSDALQAALPEIITAQSQAPQVRDLSAVNQKQTQERQNKETHDKGAQKKNTKAAPKPNKSDVEIREKTSLQLKLANNGNAVGVRAKNNREMAGQDLDSNGDGVVDPYEALGYQTENIGEGLKERLKSLEQVTEQLAPTVTTSTEDLGKQWEALAGDNMVGSAFRDKGNLEVLMGSRGVASVMVGISEALDQYLQKVTPENRFDPVSGQPDLFFLFEMLRKRKKEALTEFEREAELMLGGSIAILSIPQIIEKLIELGINPMLAKSLEGPLAKLINECKKKTDELHSLYVMIKEEAELSVRPEEEEEAVG